MVTRLLLLMTLLTDQSFAQNNANSGPNEPEIIRKGLLRAQATISPGWTVGRTETNIFLHGDLEGYISRSVSVKGDIAYYLGTQGATWLKHNHSLFFGANYHFPVGRFDPYIGLQPGVSIIQVRNTVIDNAEQTYTSRESVLKAAPAVAVSTGFNFYVWKYIHFLGRVTYVHANHPTQWGTNHALHDIRVAFGLGWNVNLVKAK